MDVEMDPCSVEKDRIQELEMELAVQAELWEIAKIAIERGEQPHFLPFMQLHDPIGRIKNVLQKVIR